MAKPKIVKICMNCYSHTIDYDGNPNYCSLHHKFTGALDTCKKFSKDTEESKEQKSKGYKKPNRVCAECSSPITYQSKFNIEIPEHICDSFGIAYGKKLPCNDYCCACCPYNKRRGDCPKEKIFGNAFDELKNWT